MLVQRNFNGDRQKIVQGSPLSVQGQKLLRHRIEKRFRRMGTAEQIL